MENNFSEIIQIHSIEASDYGVKINATDKRVFNVSKEKKTGGLTVAWQQMNDMGLKGLNPMTNEVGTIVEIWFKEVENKHGGVSRYISSFKEAGTRPVGKLGETPAQTQNSRPGAVLEPTESRVAYGRRLALHGFINGLLASGLKPLDVIKYLGELLILEDAIDKKLASPQPVSDEPADLPTIQQEEPILSDDDMPPF